MNIRAIGPGDVDRVSEFALEALAGVHNIPVHISPAKVREAVQFFATAPGHFQLAAFTGRHVCGAIAMMVAEMPFFERCEGHIFMCFANRPGVGAKLIRSLMHFVEDDFRIRRVVWMMNGDDDGSDTNTRMAYMLRRRFNFRRQLDALVFYKE